MNKIFILINLPLYEQKYEIFVPINKKVGSLKKMLLQGISELNNEKINSPFSFFICDKTTGQVYDENKTILENGITNGTEIILF